MQNVITNSVFIQKTLAFFKKYGLFLAPLLLFMLFLFLLVFSYTHPSDQSHTSTSQQTPSQAQTNNPSGSQVEYSPAPSSEEMMSDERDMNMWSGQKVFDSDFDGLGATKTTLSDGSTEYSYDSGTQNRPNIIIVQDGVNVFQRTVMNATMSTTSVHPDYIAHGSSYWGDSVITYIFLSKGHAYVANPDTKQVFEEMIFKPVDIDQFRQYDTDITGHIQKLP